MLNRLLSGDLPRSRILAAVLLLIFIGEGLRQALDARQEADHG